MPLLPAGGAHWIEPASAGVSSAVRVVLLTETSAGVFEFDAGTGTAASLVERTPGAFQIIPVSGYAAFVESPAGVFTPTPGTTSAAPIVESPTGVFTLTPGGTSTARLVQTSVGVYEIIPDSAHRATAYRLGATSNTVIY